jgi:hypothetical protein
MATGFSGGKKLEQVLARITAQAEKKTLVKVGFQDGATYPAESGNPVFVAQVAFWNEYGTVRAPARPFFRTMIAEKSAKWGPNIARMLKLNNFNVERVMGQVGEAIQGQLQASILNGGWQANSEHTIARKGFDKPLIDDAIMYRHITYQVEA